MNKVLMCGRLTRDPDVRYGENQKAVARFSLAVDRRFAKEGDQITADFFNCTAFGKTAEFIEKYVVKGTKLIITGRIQNDNYTNKDGQTVYSVQILIDELEFAESKKSASGSGQVQEQGGAPVQGFQNIPNGIDDELPFK